MSIYLDNAATTRISELALSAMNKAYDDLYANASSLHSAGLAAHSALENARGGLAALLGVRASNIFFTAGGSQGDNIAIFSSCARVRRPEGARIITTPVEHPACLNCLRELEKKGFEIAYIPVDRDGLRLEGLEELLGDDVCLVSIMHVNNETGQVFPVAEASELVHRICPGALFHCDGVQGFAKEPLRLSGTHIDSYAVSAHKFHGPKGVGFVYLSDRYRPVASIYGGGQEKGIISGTENVPGIVSMYAAAREAFDNMSDDRARVSELRRQLEACLLADGGVTVISERSCTPYILSVSFDGIRSETMLNALSAEGIYVSSGSACSSNAKSSHVLAAMGLDKNTADGAIRFSLSRYTTAEEIREVVCRVRHIRENVLTAFNFRKNSRR